LNDVGCWLYLLLDSLFLATSLMRDVTPEGLKGGLILNLNFNIDSLAFDSSCAA
jgi:hypothetical protein